MTIHGLGRPLAVLVGSLILGALAGPAPAGGQMIDADPGAQPGPGRHQQVSAEQVGAGRGNTMTPDSASFVINRDPFRAIRRGRQIFQRKFTRLQSAGTRRGRRRGRHQHDDRDRRGPLGQLRLLPRPSTRDRPARRRRRDAPRQPRRAPPVRARAEGDARRRDHGGPPAFPRPGRARRPAQRPARGDSGSSAKGIDYGWITAMPSGDGRHVPRAGRRCRPARPPLLRARTDDVDPRIRRRRAPRRDGPGCGRPGPREGGVARPRRPPRPEWSSTARSRRSRRRRFRIPASIRTGTCRATRCRRRWWTTSSSTCSTISSPPPTSRPRRRRRGCARSSRSAARRATCPTCRSTGTAAWRTWRPRTTPSAGTSTTSSPRPRPWPTPWTTAAAIPP